MIQIAAIIGAVLFLAVSLLYTAVTFGAPLGYFFAAYFSLNVVMNLFSKSKKEKILMTPLSLIASACLWLVIRGV